MEVAKRTGIALSLSALQVRQERTCFRHMVAPAADPRQCSALQYSTQRSHQVDISSIAVYLLD